MKYEEYVGNGAGPVPTKDPQSIQSDLDVIRHEMAQTLKELEERVSPQALMNEVMTRVRGSGEGVSEFFRNLGNTVRDNPVPVLLIGAGVASLAMSQRRGPAVRTHEEGASTGEEMKKRAGDMREKAHVAREKAHDVKERASEMAGRVKERGTSMASGASERVKATTERVRSGAGRARVRVREGAERARTTVDEQPLILVGLGLAAGAILGSLTPISERERQRLGPARERLIASARGGVEEVKQGLQEGLDEGARESPGGTWEEAESLSTAEASRQAAATGGVAPSTLETGGSPWVGGEVQDVRPGLGVDTTSAPGRTEGDIESKAPGSSDVEPLGGGGRTPAGGRS